MGYIPHYDDDRPEIRVLLPLAIFAFAVPQGL
jgi:hypothetical protein